MISVILLAGGTGTRMKSDVPKQYLPLRGKPIVRHSLELFLSMPDISEIVVVCDPQYQHYFPESHIIFAMPGARRQDSVYNGFQKATSDLICIHDAARPYITLENVRDVIEAAKQHGAATLGMPVKFTVKEATPDRFVSRTLDREVLWEIQTPQIVRRDLLRKGFELDVSVTDDVSLVEALGCPVKLVLGSYANIKITTPEDFLIASHL